MLCNEKQLALIRAAKDVSQSEPGAALLAHLRVFCRFEESTFVTDSHLTAFNEGMRAVYLELKRLIDIDEQNLELFDNDTIEDIAI